MDHLGQWFSNCEFQTSTFNCPWQPPQPPALQREVDLGYLNPTCLPHVDHGTPPLHYNTSPELHLRLHLKKVSECFSLEFEIQ